MIGAPDPARLRALGVDPTAGPERLAGGDTSTVLRYGDHVVKIGGPPGSSRAEAAGLRLLADAGARVPAVLAVDDELLVLAFVPPGRPDPAALGAMLAAMHAPVDAPYGSDGDVFLGGLRLPGGRSRDWTEILVEHRLRPLLRGAAPTLGDGPAAAAQRWLDRARLPTEGPCVVHGDLWAGNVLYGVDGPTLIDPCAQVGERTLDLAMMRLFGGFPDAVTRAMPPVPPALEPAIDAATLVFLFAHVVLFGAAYRAPTLRLLGRVGAD